MSLAFGLARDWDVFPPARLAALQTTLAQAGWGMFRGAAWGLFANAPLDWRVLRAGAESNWKGPYYFTLPSVAGSAPLQAALDLLCPRSSGFPLLDILPLAPLPPATNHVIDTQFGDQRWRIISAKWLLRQWQALPTEMRAAAERSFQVQRPGEPDVTHLWYCAALAEMSNKALEVRLPISIWWNGLP